MLSRVVIAFLPRSKCLLISWLQSPSAVILEPKKNSQPLFPLFPHLFAMKQWDQMPWSKFSECWALSQLFYSPLSLSLRGSLVLLHFCHKDGVICISEVTGISPGNLEGCVILWLFFLPGKKLGLIFYSVCFNAYIYNSFKNLIIHLKI